VSMDSLIAVVWSKMIQTAFDRATIFAGLCNRDYEGDAQLGNTVKINALGDPTVSTYTGTVTYEDVNTAAQALLIDQADSFSFKVKDIEKAQAAADVIPKAMRRAGRRLALKVDTFIAGFYTAISAANDLGIVAITSPDLAYQYLVALAQTLDEADVPEDGRWCTVPPWYYALLRRNNLFLQNAATGGQTLRTGKVGEVLGMDVLKSNSVQLISGDDYAVMAGVQDAFTFADQINETETLRLQDTFATGIRGLHVYGGKVVRNDGFALLRASIT